MNKVLKPFSRLAAGVSAALGWAGVALAQTGFDPVQLGEPEAISRTRFGSIPQAVRTIFNTVIAAAAAIFVILLLVGGVQYLAAAGNEEATAKAKKLLVDAIIGLIIVLAAWAVGAFILGRFFAPGASGVLQRPF